MSDKVKSCQWMILQYAVQGKEKSHSITGSRSTLAQTRCQIYVRLCMKALQPIWDWMNIEVNPCQEIQPGANLRREADLGGTFRQDGPGFSSHISVQQFECPLILIPLSSYSDNSTKSWGMELFSSSFMTFGQKLYIFRQRVALAFA